MEDSLDQVPRQPTLVEYVADRLKQYIHASGLKAGDRLPSQDELAARLGVSRNVVREAIKGLEMVGIVTSRHGGGVFVTSFDARPLASSIAFRLQSIEPWQRLQYLFEARERFELGYVDLVVQRMTPEDRAGVEQSLALMRERSALGEPIPFELDYMFHRSLLEAAHNPLISCVGEILQELFLLLARRPAPEHAPDPRFVVERHQALYDTILSGDVARARAALQEHIATSKRRWLPVSSAN